MLLNRLVVVGLCLIFGSIISAEKIRYDNYRIYQVVPRSQFQLRFLGDLEGNPDEFIFLNAPTAIGNQVNVLVAPEKVFDFVRKFSLNGLFFKLVQNNFQTVLDAEQDEMRSRSGFYDWSGYHTLEENYDWLRTMASRFSNVVQVIVGGKTYEGRDILGVKVSYNSGNKGIFIEGGIHAREWISPATITFMLNELLTSNDPEVREMAEKYDWYIFPHTNPDGFVYTHTHDRLWRKTRSPGQSCYGADPNRNWDFKWMSIGASSNECSSTYGGKTPFSEIEMKSLAEYIASLKGKIHAYLAFHSFSQLLLAPYGYTDVPAPNDDHLQQIAKVTTTALAKRYGTQYKYGSSYLAIYPTSGSSVDWVYGEVGVPVAYTYELRPASSVNGFVLPSSQIIPTAKETLDSLLALTKESARLGYL